MQRPAKLGHPVTAKRGIGFANMMDYMRIDPATGDPRLDRSDLTREQAAALTEVTALGAGALAGLGAQLWDEQALSRLPFEAGRTFLPALPPDDRLAARASWQVTLAAAISRGQRDDGGGGS